MKSLYQLGWFGGPQPEKNPQAPCSTCKKETCQCPPF